MTPPDHKARHPLMENCRALRLDEWRRQGCFQPGARFRLTWDDGAVAEVGVLGPGVVEAVAVRYREGDRVVGITIARVAYTRQHLAGRRLWLRCPDCGRRCAALYLPLKAADTIFACRPCHGLAYTSQHKTAYARAVDKYVRVLARLGVDHDPVLSPVRPRRMHARTYRRLLNEMEDARRAVRYQALVRAAR